MSGPQHFSKRPLYQANPLGKNRNWAKRAQAGRRRGCRVSPAIFSRYFTISNSSASSFYHLLQRTHRQNSTTQKDTVVFFSGSDFPDRKISAKGRPRRFYLQQQATSFANGSISGLPVGLSPHPSHPIKDIFDSLDLQ